MCGEKQLSNDELTLFASNDDWWFHAKGKAGSIIVKQPERN